MERSEDGLVRVGILGCGNVGSALVGRLDTNADLITRRSGVRIEVARVAVQNLTKERDVELAAGVLTNDAGSVVSAPDVDVIVEVIGGVDLSKLQPADVVVQGQSISLRLPQAQILVTRLDNAQTRVYSRDTGLFSSPDPNLESEVRQEAERQLQEAAMQGDILKTADGNARSTISSLLQGLGFKKVDFR
jgi:hypothetical protein